ncbi:MAG: phage portal protein [Prevotellaceae bacterium]|jgi:SPP1 family phage portal protein|nr:phage portal protein [Prevotellaceae bacterium]
MGLLDTIKNWAKATMDYNQEFEKLLAANDVTRALRCMKSHSESAIRAIKEYDISLHEIMQRKDKAVYDQKGNFKRWHKRWKIPVPYQIFINEIALVFLYGRPVKWSQESQETDKAFVEYKKLLNEIRFNAHVREAKRKAGAEGTSAILYHVYRSSEDKPELLLRVLAKSKGDDIYTIRDQYERLRAFGWGYSLTETGGKTIEHVDIYTADTIFRAKRANIGWEATIALNPIGKIPVVLFEQEVEHANVQPMIERIESLTSTDADVNDRFSNPAMVASADILSSLPASDEESKLYVIKNGGTIEYLTWDQASANKQSELERLDKHILQKSFTPNVDFENMKSLSNISGKALRQMMMLAFIKADKHKELHDEYMDRAKNLLLAIMANVLDYPNKAKYEALEITHEFQEPFGEDVSETLTDLLRLFNAGGLSRETLVEQSYLIKNARLELERIAKERNEDDERQKAINKMDIFGEAE